MFPILVSASAGLVFMVALHLLTLLMLMACSVFFFLIACSVNKVSNCQHLMGPGPGLIKISLDPETD